MAGDANYNDRSLILHFDGSNDSTSFTDFSASAHTCTAVGNAKVTVLQSVFGGASLALDGTGDSVDVTYSTALNLAGGDWCIEGRARTPASTGDSILLDFRGVNTTQASGWVVYASLATRVLGIFDGVSGVTPIITPSNSLPTAGNWFSWAISQQGGLTRIFIDGALIVSNSAFTTRATHATGIRIGLQYDGTNGWNGQFDEVRITKGIAFRTASYTIDSEAFPDTDDQPGSAIGVAPTTAFGVPTSAWGLYATSASPSTAFGATRSGLFYPATGSSFPTAFGTAVSSYRYVVGSWTSSLAFGTPVITLNTNAAASTIGTTTGVGTPFAFRGIVPEPVGLAQSLDVPVRFGLAVATFGKSCAATGFTTTIIPGHGLRLTQAADAWTVSTAFGTPGPRRGGMATGFTTTVFGQPQIGATGLPQGFSLTAFGIHTARARFDGTATGFSTTQIPAITTSAAPSLRTRGARFRQAWGVAQAERTAP